MNKKNFPLLLLLPLLLLSWIVFLHYYLDPYHSRSIDPEFAYLMNGLNCAQLHFSWIGHVDHPGTPFQIFCGIIIWITHIFEGKSDIVQDVINNPDTYLNAISLSIGLVQTILLGIIGIVAIKKNISIEKVLILQSGFIFNDVVIWLFSRVNPDVFFIIITNLFIIVYLVYGYKDYAPRKFAIWSGLIMAMGFATKFNYLPLLFLPLFLIRTNKNRLIYAGTGVVSFIVLLLPIINKFQYYKRFIIKMLTHDGQYGNGSESVINLSLIFDSFKQLVKLNPELLVLILVLVLCIVLSIIKRKDEGHKNYKAVYLGLIVVFTLQFLLVSKHYTNYYLTPLFSLLGYCFFLIADYFSILFKRVRNYWFMGLLLPFIFLISVTHKVDRDFTVIKKEKTQRLEISDFVEKNISKSDIWFVEPTWKSAPFKENGLVFGFSYCGHREKYLPYLMKSNPNIITYEGENEKVKLWRIAPVELDSIFLLGKKINIYSSPGRNANDLYKVLTESALKSNVQLKTDTLYRNQETNEMILAINAISSH